MNLNYDVGTMYACQRFASSGMSGRRPRIGASTVFSDEHALLIDDPEHSEQEARFVILGLSVALRTLVVCHCYRRGGDVVRIISARRANRKERTLYNQRWHP